MNQPGDRQKRPRSLLLAVLLGIGVSAVFIPAVEGLTAVISREPIHPQQVWVGYLAIRVLSGACLGAAWYWVGGLSRGALRLYLNWILLFLFIGGGLQDYASRSAGEYLFVRLAGGLLSGLVMGSIFLAWEGLIRARRRSAARE